MLLVLSNSLIDLLLYDNNMHCITTDVRARVILN